MTIDEEQVQLLLQHTREACGVTKWPAVSLGRVVITPGASERVARDRLVTCLALHQAGLWGVLPAEDARENAVNLAADDGRLMSAWAIDELKPSKGYGDNTLWIITQGEGLKVDSVGGMTVTTLLLPEEY